MNHFDKLPENVRTICSEHMGADAAVMVVNRAMASDATNEQAEDLLDLLVELPFDQHFAVVKAVVGMKPEMVRQRAFQRWAAQHHKRVRELHTK